MFVRLCLCHILSIATRDVILVEGENIILQTYHGLTFTQCNAKIPFELISSTVICDILFSLVTMYLFVNPLRIILKTINRENQTTFFDSPLHNLMIRYTLLTCLALVSTFIFLIFIGIVGSASIIAFDVVVK